MGGKPGVFECEEYTSKMCGNSLNEMTKIYRKEFNLTRLTFLYSLMQKKHIFTHFVLVMKKMLCLPAFLRLTKYNFVITNINFRSTIENEVSEVSQSMTEEEMSANTA